MSRLAVHRIELASGSRIPAIGLGTWRAEPGVVGAAVSHALSVGYRHIDCATAYSNEGEIGAALSAFFKANPSVRREEVWLTSKLWNTHHASENVRKCLETTLKHLQVDHLDLWLMHWPVAFIHGDVLFPYDAAGKMQMADVPIRETWQAMEQLHREGLVKNIGVSNFTQSRLRELLSFATVKPAVNQIELHPYLPQNELLAFLNEHGIHPTAYSPLGSGDFVVNAKKDTTTARVLEDPLIGQIAGEVGKSPAQVLIRWAVQRGTSVIPKSSNPARISENLAVFDWSLSEEQMARIATLGAKKIRYVAPVWSPFDE